jgi:flagellar hook-associated protein 2
MANINTFVSSYNSVSSYIHTQGSYDATEQTTGGILFGDGTLSSVKSDLTSILIGSVWGVSSNYSTLGLIGISVDTAGQLTVNDSKLRGYLTTNFNDVQKLFTASGETSVGTLSYISHDNSTIQGEYTVHIDTAATQSTSAASDNTTLSGDETLTITEGNNTAVVNLTSGMTMAQIVSAVNSELETVYTQVLAGGEQLYSDAGHTTAINSATTWNSIYDSLGNSANLLNDDVISFSGTSRSGSAISGSYTISDTATDTVQGLLSAIETAFANGVTAAINGSGQIVITDKTSGESSVALSLNTTLAHDLDFGDVLTGNSGGQEGRYAMAITASADSGNHLVLNHDSYGTGNSFTVHQANNLLWTGGDQTVNNGLDVAGTINGEAATGSGQILTGNSGEANVDGLVIKYTGTTGGVDAGTVKLTLGVAELYDRALFNITDTIDGYLAFKQQSLQDSIKGYETQIDDMEARLELKREQMLTRFINMELALQKIQSQSNWLAGQLSAASGGWGRL